MAQQTIGIGTSANDGTGDTIRDAFDKCNDNFTELYTGLTGLLDFKGSTDCSANPNYPAASKGDFYLVSVAGKIGGASGIAVEVGDSYFATADNAGGTQASVGTSWTVIQGNITSYLPLTGGTLTGDLIVPSEVYGAGWNGSNEVPTKNDVYDKIETVAAGSGSTTLAGLTDVDTSGVADGDALTYDSGSSKWVPGAGGGGGSTGEGALVVPSASDYTLQNAGSNATINTVANGMLLSQPTGTSAAGIKFAKNTAGPASLTAFTLTVRCKIVGIATNNSYPCSIVLRETTGGKVLIFSSAYLRGTQYLVQRWSSYTSFSANAIGPSAFQGTVAFPWMRITVGSGTITFYLSPDGVNWTSVGTESVATFLGAINEVGVGCYIAGNLEDASTIFQSIELT